MGLGPRRPGGGQRHRLLDGSNGLYRLNMELRVSGFGGLSLRQVVSARKGLQEAGVLCLKKA